MTMKRVLGEVDGNTAHVKSDICRKADQDQKRCRTTGPLTENAAPGWTEQLCRGFLERLLSAVGTAGCAVQKQHDALQLASIPEAAWYCFAEMNLLLEQNWSRLPAEHLKGYHSFMRRDKGALWADVLSTEGVAAPGRVSAGPPHVQLLHVVLHHIFRASPQASMVQYTLRVPAWMHGWCRRWGYTAADIGLLEVRAHGCCSENQAQQLPSRLYIPVF